MSRNLCIVISLLFITAAVAPAQLRADDADDTRAILALSQYGAQLQLNQGRVVGLTLQGEAVDDEALHLAAGLDRLQSLSLRGAKVTGAGLKHLRGLPQLRELSIHDTPLTDRDIDELAALKSVVQYDLRGTQISGMGKQRLESLLQKAMRDATVQLHCGGFFGVAGLYDERPCTLTNVIADSAAADAGLQVGDVIAKFDGRSIESFTELVEAVRLTPPEQPIRVVIERDGRTIEKTVSLRRASMPP